MQLFSYTVFICLLANEPLPRVTPEEGIRIIYILSGSASHSIYLWARPIDPLHQVVHRLGPAANDGTGEHLAYGPAPTSSGRLWPAGTIIPAQGHLRLTQLQPQHLQKF